jgi:sugar (pentulose or hexulose) kinase
VLGIDVGSSGVRAAVVDVDGSLLGRAARPLETVVSAPGRAEHDPRAWRAAALETGSEAVVQAGEIEVVASGSAPSDRRRCSWTRSSGRSTTPSG